jgi:hypothetical protein
MKRFLFVVALGLGLFPPFGQPIKAETGIPATMNIKNTASSALYTVYNSVGSSTFDFTLSGKANIAIYNGTAASVAVSTTSDRCNSSSVDNFVVPASTGFVAEKIVVKKSICVRSLSGASVNSGVIYTSTW